ncbi:MAG: hypothetical protein QOD86_1824 [Miltoncostaeaceae bacterium]|jgi:hypothetical protein|nr:hypothetical protein [Miltoncostaeaceae bacterium]
MKRQTMKRHIIAIGTSAALLSFGGAAALATTYNTSTQNASNMQVLPIALGAGVSAPVNANVPVGALDASSNGGSVTQNSEATSSGTAKNAETVQSVRQQGGAGGGTNTATQSSSNMQVIGVAGGAGVAAPINANVPVSALGASNNNGAVDQAGKADASGRAVNSGVAQDVDQSASNGAKNTATQKSSSMQVLPIALGAGVAAPVNAHVPVAVLSANSNNGDTMQRGEARARANGANNSVAQSIRQEGTHKGTENTAAQGASNQQVLAAALGAALGIPVSAHVPVAALSADDNNKGVNQSGKADSSGESINNDVKQSARQSDTQQAVAKMVSNVADAMSDAGSAQDMLGGL